MQKNQFDIARLSILIFLTSSCLVAGQVRREGLCPNINYLSNVQSQPLQGTWYMQTRYPFLDDVFYRCQETDYNLEPNNEYTIRTFEIKNEDDSGRVGTGRLTLLQHGLFRVQYDDALPFDHKILSLDCDNYIIIYACQNLPLDNKHFEYVWIHTRVRNPTQEVKETYMADLNRLGISTHQLASTCQENCEDFEIKKESIAQKQSK
ncbi:lopap-like isoform X2 [Eurosta solidaginis]|uniref:lopap-like isoform X2 n=1 Tax=Eurosta solidaginis TaxID=178769 RepID=UPI003531523A